MWKWGRFVVVLWFVAATVYPLTGGCAPERNPTPTAQPDKPDQPEVPSVQVGEGPPVVLERIEEFRQAVLKNPSSARAWGDLGQTFEVHYFNAQAATSYRRAASLAPNEFRWPYFLGCCLSSFDQTAAIDAYERAIRINPKYGPVHVRLGDAYLRNDRIADAEKQYREALAIDPFDAFAYLGLARVATVREDFAQAAESVESALELRDDLREGHRLAAQVYGRLGRREAVRAATERAEKLDADPAIPDAMRDGLAEFGVSAGWHATRGEALLDRGEFAAAADEFRRAIRLEPETAGHHFRLASALHSAGERKTALSEYAEALRLRPDYAEAHFNYAVLLTEVGRQREAVEQYRRALEDNPGLADARENLGTLLASMGQYEEGIEALRGAAKDKPDSADVRYNLGLALLSAGRAEEARAAWDEAISIDERHSPSLTQLAQLAVRRGDLNEAITLFTRALEIDRSRPEHYNNLGIALSMAGRAGDAVRVFRDGLKVMPNHAGMYNKLAWILATAADDELRDGGTALQMAERLCKDTGFRNPRFLETLAAAQAEVGRFDQAAETLRAGIGLIQKARPGSRMIERFKARIKQCAQHRTFREALIPQRAPEPPAHQQLQPSGQDTTPTEDRPS